MSPAFTRSPSRTRSSPTTPPVGCCTFLTFESTTIEPCAISAPEISAVDAQPPTPIARNATITTPAKMWRRIEACELGHVLRFILLLPDQAPLSEPAAAAPTGSRG